MDNSVFTQIMERKSVRQFLDQPLTKEEEDSILQAACQSPTAGNQQLYTILKITDPDLKSRLADLCDHQKFIATAPFVLVFLADCVRWKKVYDSVGITSRDVNVGDLMLAFMDSCIAAQNAVVAAWSLGIGSCYIGDILENKEDVSECLHLPRHIMPAGMLVFGYPTQQQLSRKKPSRFDLDYIVQENTYRERTSQEHQEAFEKRAAKDGLKTFSYKQWIEAFVKRKYDSDFSQEMSRSTAMYLNDFKK